MWKVLELVVILQLITPALAEICTDSVCKYKFVVSRRRTMTWTDPNNGTTFQVEVKGKDMVIKESTFRTSENYPDYIGRVIPLDEVITCDGYERDLFVINGQFPGPTIEVMHNAEVEVEVESDLRTEGFVIHWHGVHMKGTPHMDGTTGVNQCPIHPYQRFTYKFKADPIGTHFYHGHHGFQRVEGMIGFFIVWPEMPTLPYFAIMVSDWFHAEGVEMETAHPCGFYFKGHGAYTLPDDKRFKSVDNIELTANIYEATILDGRGRFENNKIPYNTKQVVTDQEYMFTMANAGGEFSYEITVDDHKLTVIASDGAPIEPLTVDILIIHPGERKDFTLTISRSASRFWMRADTLVDDKSVKQGSLMILSTDDSGRDPTTKKIVCTNSNPCTVYNCPFPRYPYSYHKTCISLEQAKSAYTPEQINDEFGTQEPIENVRTMFFNFASTRAAAVNGRRFHLPRAPVHQLSADQLADYIVPCDEEACKVECECTYAEVFNAGEVVEAIFLSYDNTDFHHHVIHTHGTNFAVMKIGYFQIDNVTAHIVGANTDISCDEDDIYCNRAYWTNGRPTEGINDQNPILKDSVVIPSNGYVMLRFKADNPGWWAVHCHQETHVLEGMVVAWLVDPGNIPPLPDDFPTCWDFPST